MRLAEGTVLRDLRPDVKGGDIYSERVDCFKAVRHIFAGKVLVKRGPLHRQLRRKRPAIRRQILILSLYVISSVMSI